MNVFEMKRDDVVRLVRYYRKHGEDYEANFKLSESQWKLAAQYEYFIPVIETMGGVISGGKVYFPDAKSKKYVIDYMQQFKDGDLYNVVGYYFTLEDSLKEARKIYFRK